MSLAEPLALRLAVALGIGLLIGAERERRKGSGPRRSAAGIRTFALTSLAGGVCLLLGGELLLGVAAIGVVVFSAIAYQRSASQDPGLTSEMALFATLLFGALAIRQPGLAAGLAVVVTILLAARARLHRLLRDLLTEQESHDALLFAAATLVVLPLMPNHPVGPYGVANPRRLWELVVIVMAISGAGYIALRSLGPRLGLPFAGLSGGFVSATATIGSMGARAKRNPMLARGAVAGAALSSLATIIQMAVVLLAVSLPTLRALWLPLAFAGIAAAGYASFLVLSSRGTGKERTIDPGRAFSLKAAFLFATTLLAVLFVAAAVTQWLGETGSTIAAGLAGLADTHAAAISIAALVNAGKLSVNDAAVPILTGLTTNTLTKAVVAATLGGRSFFVKLFPALVLMTLAAWAGLLVRW